MRSSAIGAGITGISDRYGGQMGWANARGIRSASRISSRDVQYADRLWRRGVRARPEGLCSSAPAPSGVDATLLPTARLKIYEADLNPAGSDRLMSLIPADQAGVKLQTIIKKVRRHLFVFVDEPRPHGDHNGSERALRPCAVYRKITNGFSKQWGRRALRRT